MTALRLVSMPAASWAFRSATFCTNCLFFDVRSPSAWVTSRTAGLMWAKAAVKLPSLTSSTAPLTAPHSVWPITTRSLAPATFVANPVYLYMSGEWQLRMTFTGAFDDAAIATVEIR